MKVINSESNNKLNSEFNKPTSPTNGSKSVVLSRTSYFDDKVDSKLSLTDMENSTSSSGAKLVNISYAISNGSVRNKMDMNSQESNLKHRYNNKYSVSHTPVNRNALVETSLKVDSAAKDETHKGPIKNRKFQESLSLPTKSDFERARALLSKSQQYR